MKLRHRIVSDNFSYFQTVHCIIPVVQISRHEVVLIDSGESETPEMIPMLKEQGLRVRAVLHTHLHTDHMANDKLLIRNFGTQVYAHPEEIWRVQSREYLKGNDMYPTEGSVQ